MQTESNAERLHGTENYGQIARPLRDLLAAQFAFFLQLGEGLIHHRQQLQNDGRGDVGHDAEGKDGEATELASGEQIHEAQEGATVLLEELLQFVCVHARSGDVAAEAVYGQQCPG